ncbi:hypothetical protein CEXT_662281 [Caerostris extrusa]|uniref:Uncharacterized protein n=1 Tax=Caerostris extrusa TaxID=172846 RepID=A0AAV4N9W2_CAEEX|nr:hypothetical protein CEXT_662281 [Caerostris extrusa]
MKGRKRQSYALLNRDPPFPRSRPNDLGDKRKIVCQAKISIGRHPEGAPTHPRRRFCEENRKWAGEAPARRTGGVRQTPYGASAVEGRDLTLRPRNDSKHPSCSLRRSARLN